MIVHLKTGLNEAEEISKAATKKGLTHAENEEVEIGRRAFKFHEAVNEPSSTSSVSVLGVG